MSRRLEGGEPKAIAYAPSTNLHPMETKAATMPRYSDIPVATPRSVRGNFLINFINCLCHCWLIMSISN